MKGGRGKPPGGGDGGSFRGRKEKGFVSDADFGQRNAGKRPGARPGQVRDEDGRPAPHAGWYEKGATERPAGRGFGGKAKGFKPTGDKMGGKAPAGGGPGQGKGNWNKDWNPNRNETRGGARGESQGARAGSGRHAGHRPGGKASGAASGYGRGPGIKPSKAALGQLLTQYGVDLPSPTLDKLWAYHQLLREHNHDQDLTRLIGFDTIAQRHYADCMILHGMMQGRWPSPLVDVGSGAGFPGMMIKLMSPATKIVLAEPRPRRVQFLEMVIRELGLSDISVFGHKVTSRSLTQPFAGAITRAFETVEKTLPRFGGCLGLGGKAIFMKGPKAVEEVASFQSDEYKIIRNQAYRIPNTQQDRVLLILERIRVPEPGAVRYEESQELDVAPSDPDDG